MRTGPGVAVAAVLAVGLLVGSGGPVWAEPTPPVAEQVKNAQIAAEATAERLEEARGDLATARNDQAAAEQRRSAASERVVAARLQVAEWARKTYIESADRPDALPNDPRSRMFGHPDPETDSAQAWLADAEAAERTAISDVHATTALADAAADRVERLSGDLSRHAAEIKTLKAGKERVLAAAQSDQEAVDAARASEYIRDAKGVAAPAVLKAIEFALAQRGKPYVWGAEGPDTYDCSGLVQTAFASAGIALPRTARPQFRATQLVSTTELLPGDLLFFATDKSNWDSIHHVAIYLGNGKMLHAPTTGDVVRVAPVWWEEFYAATRVVPGSVAAKPIPIPVPAPTKPAPTTSPTPSKSPSPSPSGSASPSGTPSPSGSPSPSGTPSPSGSASPSRSPSPSGSTAASPSPSAGRSSAAPTTCPPSPSGSPSPTPSGSPSPTPTRSPSPSPSASRLAC